ncbi:hypothetical protein ACIQMP_08025 [Streptomyces sp. NPDC091385]|uniref:hypothetical protein n=1 Tax=Streptomyces sp. NPDC091385 TaxID=3365997 RepID=UPI0037F1733C
MKNGPGICPTCRRAVIWTRTEAGKQLPVDPTPDADGNTAVRRDGTTAWISRRITAERPLWGPEKQHKPHFATCGAQTVLPLPPGVARLADRRNRNRGRS